MSDQHRLVARGWTADWLNGWLAAIGAAVVTHGLRVSWTDGPRPCAVLHHDADPTEAIWASLPSGGSLAASVTARELPGLPALPRNYGPDAFASRARLARSSNDWSLGPCTTDLLPPSKPKGPLDHGPFDVPAPRGVTLHDRVVSCREAIGSSEDVHGSLMGTPALAPMNGLGFDARRVEPGVIARSVLQVDPVVEVLAWCALDLFPVVPVGRAIRSRGWRDTPTKVGAFCWSTWTRPLDRWAIDAALDQPRLPGATRWESVPYEPKGSADVTRAYASRRVRDG